MKTKALLVILMLILLSSCRSVVAPEFDLDPIVKKEKSENLEYKDLKAESEVIVRVEVLDKLRLANSVVKNKDDFHSLREVKVLEVLKNDEDNELEEDDEIVVHELAAIDLNNVYYTSNHMPLEENVEYVLYLTKDEEGHYMLVDGDNAVVNVDNIVNNQNFEVTVNTIFEYFKPILNNKELPFTLLKMVDQPTDVKFERVTIKTERVAIPVRVGINQTTSKEYIQVGNTTFELEKPILKNLMK